MTALRPLASDLQAQQAAASLRAVALARRLQGLEKVRRSFVSEAAHELNTPLTPLRIHVEALGDRTDLNPAQRDHVRVIQRNVLRLCGLVEGMLDVALNDADRLALDLAEIPLAQALGEAAREAAAAAADAGVTVELVPPGNGLLAQGDRPAVAKVLRILLSNAVQFTPRGGHVTVAAQVQGPDVVVRVTDSGLGLTDEQLARLFQPFSRPHDAPVSGARGAGLGLVIAKGLVERQGGRIWAESPGPGQGSTFSFTLRRDAGSTLGTPPAPAP